MRNIFVHIINEYHRCDKSLAEKFMKNHKVMREKIGHLPIQRDLTTYLILCFVLNPIKESNWKVYKKLLPNQKVGFLSRKLMGMAEKLKISQLCIEKFETTKDSWKWSKKHYKVDTKSEEGKAKFKKAVKSWDEHGDMGDIYQMIKNEEHHDKSHRKMFVETYHFIELILEKSLHNIIKEIREHKTSTN